MSNNIRDDQDKAKEKLAILSGKENAINFRLVRLLSVIYGSFIIALNLYLSLLTGVISIPKAYHAIINLRVKNSYRDECGYEYRRY